jgi:hypothetical protein
MSIIINTRNEAEEDIVAAFLNSLKINYRSTAEFESDETLHNEFLSLYNQEIDEPISDVDTDSFVSHEDVEELLAQRRKTLK